MRVEIQYLPCVCCKGNLPTMAKLIVIAELPYVSRCLPPLSPSYGGSVLARGCSRRGESLHTAQL